MTSGHDLGTRPRRHRWTALAATGFTALAGLTACANNADRTQSVTTPAVDITPFSTARGATPETTASASIESTPPATHTPTASTNTTTATTTSTATLPSTTTTIAPTTSTTAAAGSLQALDVLALITVTNEHPAGYERDRFGYPADPEGDRCDTRDEVLRRDSRTPTQVDPAGCQVLAGDWLSPYDGIVHTDPAELQIDHVVSAAPAPRGARRPTGLVDGMPLTGGA